MVKELRSIRQSHNKSDSLNEYENRALIQNDEINTSKSNVLFNEPKKSNVILAEKEKSNLISNMIVSSASNKSLNCNIKSF
jgi:hypothetical protein